MCGALILHHQVPLLVYGGPKLQPDEAPSVDAVKIPESLVILEFLADIFPDAHLLPSDAVLRARVRLFNAALDAKLFQPFITFLFGRGAGDLLAGLEDIQALLPPTGYVVGEWSIADAAVMPLLTRIRMALRYALGMLDPAATKEALDIFESPKFARLHQYIDENMARPSMVKTWDEVRTYNRNVGIRAEVTSSQPTVKQKYQQRTDKFRQAMQPASSK